MRRNALLSQASLGNPRAVRAPIERPAPSRAGTVAVGSLAVGYPRQPASASSVVSKSVFEIPPMQGEVAPLFA